MKTTNNYKKDIEITLNLGGIAKGSAADRIIFLLSENNLKVLISMIFMKKKFCPNINLKIYMQI